MRGPWGSRSPTTARLDADAPPQPPCCRTRRGLPFARPARLVPRRGRGHPAEPGASIVAAPRSRAGWRCGVGDCAVRDRRRSRRRRRASLLGADEAQCRHVERLAAEWLGSRLHEQSRCPGRERRAQDPARRVHVHAVRAFDAEIFNDAGSPPNEARKRASVPGRLPDGSGKTPARFGSFRSEAAARAVRQRRSRCGRSARADLAAAIDVRRCRRSCRAGDGNVPGPDDRSAGRASGRNRDELLSDARPLRRSLLRQEPDRSPRAGGNGARLGRQAERRAHLRHRAGPEFPGEASGFRRSRGSGPVEAR